MAEIGGGIVYIDGEWHQGNPHVLGPRSHAVWMSSVVFDGARAFQGVAPDLDLHCARTVKSARIMGLDPAISGAEIEKLAWQGIKKFPKDAELYISPMFFAETGFIMADPESTRFSLSVSLSPLPPADGFSACLTGFRRPAPDMAPTGAKASCLYPNVARAIAEAKQKGYDTGVVMDPYGNLAEFAYANIFMVRDGTVHTPAINDTFLNGITRQRVIGLLQEASITVVERAISYDELSQADEIFGTGNYYKLAPCIRLDDRKLSVGAVFRKAREFYFSFALGSNTGEGISPPI